MKQGKRLFGSRRGNAMIEFALSAMVLTYAFTGVFQFGYSMYLYNELEGAVRAGARYGSLATISTSGSGIDTAWRDKVRNVVVFGNPSPAAGASPVIPGLAVGNVSATFDYGTGTKANVPNYVTIKVSSYSLDAIVKTFNLTDKPSLAMPFMGQFCYINGSASC